MEIQLIQSELITDDAIDLIGQMIHVKIKYHEDKIKKDSSEEDIKRRETRIKQLQDELHKVRETYKNHNANLNLDAVIKVI